MAASVGWPAQLSHGAVGVRDIRRGDAETWRRLHAENRGWLVPWEATLPAGAGLGATSYRQLVRGLRTQARDGRTLPFVVTVEDEMVGQLTVSSITWGSARWASIGYWLARQHAGKGIMPLAVAMVIDHCFARLGLHRIEVAIRPENAASLAVVRKLGIEQFGMAPRYLHIDGEWRDHLLFAVTTEEVDTTMVARLGR